MTTHRLVIAAPDNGWLTVTTPRDPVQRRGLAHAWNDAAKRSVIAAKLPFMEMVIVRAQVRPQRTDPVGGWGIHVAEDVRPTLHEVYAALVQASVIVRHDRTCVVDEALTLGVPTGEAGGQGYLVLTLREVVSG